MNRHCHRIRHNDANYGPSSMLFFDTETQRTVVSDRERIYAHRLRLGCAIYVRQEGGRITRRTEHTFTTQEQFWDIVSSHLKCKQPLWVFAHNLMFDFRIVGGFRIIENSDQSQWRCVYPPGPTIMSGVINGKKVKFVDSGNYFPVPLRTMGQSIGLPKGDMPDWSESEDCWSRYCMRDTEICCESTLALMRYCRETNKGVWGVTMAQLAMHAWRHRTDHPFPVVHNHKAALDLECSAYFGGRSETYRLGNIDGPLYAVDCNALYPYCMKRWPYPTELVCYRQFPSRDWVRAGLRDHIGVAGVRLKSDNPDYPVRGEVYRDPASGVVSPHRFHPDSRGKSVTYYPVGSYHTFLCGQELQQAIDREEVMEVTSCALYNQDDIFSGFVHDLYRERIAYSASGNHAFSAAAKYLSNSLAGKFGQHGSSVRANPRLEPPVLWGNWTRTDADSGELIECSTTAGVTVERQPQTLAPDACPIISACITSAGRMYIDDVKRIVGVGHYHYQATDSLLITEAGLKRLADRGFIHPKDLGSFKIEQFVTKAVIHGPGDIELDYDRSIYGVPKCAERTGDDEYVGRVFESYGDMWQRLEREEIIERDVLVDERHKAVEKHGHDTILESKQHWRLSRVYIKGVVSPQGVCLPFVLQEGSLASDELPPPFPPEGVEPGAEGRE